MSASPVDHAALLGGFTAALWGGVAGAALLVGAAVGYLGRLPQRLVAATMAFGAGTLLAALAFELMDSAYARGGFDSTAVGFVGGAVVYTACNVALSRAGARQRKRSGDHQARERTDREQEGGGDGGLAIALGALIDGIPESLVIGTSMLAGGAVSWITVVAVFVSNIPEGLSSSAGMRRAGRGPGYVFGIWGAITVASAAAAWCGFALFQGASAETIAATTAVAAGGILAMVADTMIPEAFAETHDFAGLITVAGFLASFVLAKLG